MTEVKMRGSVKWYNVQSGYGFIKIPGREKDIFFHAKQWHAAKFNRLPIENEAVQFTAVEGPKGTFATDIMKG